MVSVSITKDGITHYHQTADKYFNIFLSQTERENIPINWHADNCYSFNFNGAKYIITSDIHIDNK